MQGLMYSWEFLCYWFRLAQALPEGKSLPATQSELIAIIGIHAYEEPKVRKVR